MQKLFTFIKNNLLYIRLAFFFVLTVIAIVYLFPSERQFKYEFKKGIPWMHEDYVAKFSFPIIKSDAELTAERDSILKLFKPYFTYLDDISIQQDASLEKDFNNIYQKQFGSGVFNLSRKSDKSQKSFADTTLMLLKGLINNVYDNGIIENDEIYEGLVTNNSDIVVIRQGIGEEINISEVYTQKHAYEFVKRKMEEFTKNYAGKYEKNMKQLLSELNINDYLSVNLRYDEATSNKAKEELITGISLTKGMIQKGERVISAGEVVDANKYLVLISLKKEYESGLGGGTSFLIYLGKIMIILSIILVLYLFLFSFRFSVLENFSKTFFLLFMVLIFIAVSSVVIKWNANIYYVIPIAILPIIIRIFYDGRLAFFIHMVTILIIGFFVPNSFEFTFLSFIAGIVAIISLTSSARRAKLVVTAILVSFSYCFVYFGFAILQEGNFEGIDWINFARFGLNGLFILIAYPLIYVFEKTFGFLSDATLMELADTNQPLLRQLAEKAPGTFQHSMQVANLAEEAIIKIGGNPLLVRTGALYHDIGKMEEPIFFIENQSSGFNPHENLEFSASARKIINHVTKGIEIAKKNNLPQPIIDFIRTHHGTTTVQYFYKSYIKKFPDKKDDIDKFKYPGPRPFSKETAVLMMADSTEAASRSLKEVTKEALFNLVDGIIDYQVAEKQFDEAPITFKDITTIKQIFKQKLINIYHARISYPK